VCPVSQFNSIQFIAGVSIDLSVATTALHDILTQIGHYSGQSQMYTESHYNHFIELKSHPVDGLLSRWLGHQ